MQTFIKGERVRIKKDLKINPEVFGLLCTVLYYYYDDRVYVKLDKPSKSGYTELCMFEDELEKV